ncbi:MAG: hypothetical protein CO099_05840 [Bdellovibrio sp. CG_4_9_14_3_um_filter_39_7]|nr:MAG: hypothetical protein CO099_05840 [Bdellovibrio sp. CG_4_9_14_3_um_filter_39_7]
MIDRMLALFEDFFLIIIDYYFDFQSPYSYLSWKLIERIKFNQNTSFNPIPVAMGPIIKSHETKGPAEIGTKRDYLMKDCLRKAFLNDFPMQIPFKLPFNSLDLLRMSLKEISGDQQLKLITLFFSAVWEQKLDVENQDVLKSLLMKENIDFEDLNAQSGSKLARSQLKINIQSAIDLDLFGVPTFIVQKDGKQELFWGADSIPSLLKFIEGKDQLDLNKYQQYLELFQAR